MSGVGRTGSPVRRRHTADETVARTRAVLTGLGFEPVDVLDRPGQVAARVLYPMINAAHRLAGENAASIGDIDRLLSWRFGPLSSPLRCADRIGVDILVEALEQIHARTGDPSCLPRDTPRDKLAIGELGMNSGRGSTPTRTESRA